MALSSVADMALQVYAMDQSFFKEDVKGF